MRAEDMVGTFDQQASQVDVAGLGDAELRISISRLTASRSETEIAPDIATLLEALLASQGQHEGQSRDVTHAVYLQQGLGLRILRLAKFLDLAIILLDLRRHRRDLLEHRTERLCESWRHHCQTALGEAARRGCRHPMAAGLRQSADSVHCSGAQPDHKISGADQGKSFLLLDCPVRDWP